MDSLMAAQSRRSQQLASHRLEPIHSAPITFYKLSLLARVANLITLSLLLASL